MQSCDVPPHLRGLERRQSRPSAQSKQKIESVTVVDQGPLRQTPLVAKRLEVFPDQRFVRVNRRGPLSHSGNRYRRDARAAATNSPMRRKKSVPIPA